MKHVPIPMTDIDCPRKCCNARYCSLILAWATTIHKFQGFKADIGKHDAIKHIIADINTLKWEKNHPGTAYVVASQAKTIGRATVESPYPRKSNLFFTGTLATKGLQNACTKRMERNAWQLRNESCGSLIYPRGWRKRKPGKPKKPCANPRTLWSNLSINPPSNLNEIYKKESSTSFTVQMKPGKRTRKNSTLHRSPGCFMFPPHGDNPVK